MIRTENERKTLIEKIGQVRADKIMSEEYYNEKLTTNLKKIDTQKLRSRIVGGEILDLDGIDYPNTDGLELFIKTKDNRVMYLLIEGIYENEYKEEDVAELLLRVHHITK